VDRNLEWPRCVNARDLGGLNTVDGRQTRWRAVVRSDGLDRLDWEGWSALEAYGVRTIVDLRNDVEREAGRYSCPLTVLHVPVEDDCDLEFIARWRPLSTPHYYQAALERWPGRLAAAITAVARAGPGGVVVHCGAGRDRTGLVVLLLLALVRVRPEEIADDYEVSATRLPPLDVERYLAASSRVNPRTITELEEDLAKERLRRKTLSDREAILTTVASLDARAYLAAAGVGKEDLERIEHRLLPGS
jgi:protein tyrosine/serine phosphatase